MDRKAAMLLEDLAKRFSIADLELNLVMLENLTLELFHVCWNHQ